MVWEAPHKKTFRAAKVVERAETPENMIDALTFYAPHLPVEKFHMALDMAENQRRTLADLLINQMKYITNLL